MKIHKEPAKRATELKAELIKELTNKPIKFVAVIEYYYEITALNEKIKD